MSECVLLTGATGFVGRQVLAALLDSGAQVRVIVRHGKEAGLADRPGVESVLTTHDLFAEPATWWSQALAGVQTVVHCAWYAEPGKYLQSPINLHCLEGTLRLGLAATQAGVTRFVGIGTCFEYDVDACFLQISTPLRPRSLYASAKAAAFFNLQQLFLSSEVDFAWCRLFYLYGEGEDPRRLVPYLHQKLRAGELVELTDGHQIRDYLDVKVAGRQIAEVTLGDHTGPLNICSNIPTTVRQMCESIADLYDQRALLRFGARQPHHTDPPCVVGFKSFN
ncbi:MAG: NAD-dependent epimerase/dehydratase [Burkholderiales bacterium]|nr:MAG: NAD-dependent epimerase/dehydratase [Burkholderiales bacterium]